MKTEVRGCWIYEDFCIMEKQNKGHVYFIKHIGLTPVKIGYSSEKNLKNRLNNFNTSSPYGIYLIGLINSENPKKLESEIHKKFKEKRLNGEWFDLTEKDLKVFFNYKINLKKGKNKNEKQGKKYLFNQLEQKQKTNISEFSKIFNVSRQTVYNWINEFNS